MSEIDKMREQRMKELRGEEPTIDQKFRVGLVVMHQAMLKEAAELKHGLNQMLEDIEWTRR